nr:unnamed protein product [Spirometra erinaceieuropaei]
MREKATWMHPPLRHWHLLDYVLVRRRDQRDALVTKVILGAEKWTDHRLVIIKMRIRPQPHRRPQGKRPPRKLSIALLSLPAQHLHLSNELVQRLANMPVAAAADENASVDKRWCQLRDTVQSTALAVLGRARRQHQHCFYDNDAAISNLLAEENEYTKATRCLVQQRLCEKQNIAGRIFARILLNRLNYHLEQDHVSESQCNVRRHRGTTDMTFVARQLQECREMRAHVSSTFVDLTKALDTMVRQLHDGMIARVTDKRAVSDASAVANGVEQDCVQAPTLFSLILSAMLMDAYSNGRLGTLIAYRTDGHLSQRRMHFQWRVSTTAVHELLFADDCALNTTSEGGMQRSMDLFSAARHIFGLIINTETVVMHQPPSGAAYVATQINVTAPNCEW